MGINNTFMFTHYALRLRFLCRLWDKPDGETIYCTYMKGNSYKMDAFNVLRGVGEAGKGATTFRILIQHISSNTQVLYRMTVFINTFIQEYI